jgi:5'-3' exoribonuclease 1
MNESGELILSRFETYLTELSKYDYDRFAKENESTKHLHRINSSKPKTSELDKDQVPNSGFSAEIMEKLMITTSKETSENDCNGLLIDNFIANERQPENVTSSSSDDDINPPVYPDADDDGPSSDSEHVSDNDEEKKKYLRMISNNEPVRQKSVGESEFRRHKDEYYREKMKSESVSTEQLQLYVQQYIEALQWILKYYYQGCPSWSWFYPHHYAPYLSDLTNFKHLNFDFTRGTPFKPFEQLLGMSIHGH